MGFTSRLFKTLTFNIFILCILQFWVQSTALASPLVENSVQFRSLEKRYSGTPAPKQGTGGPATSDYPSDDEIRAYYIQPSGPYVFFSVLPNAFTNQAPYNFSKTVGGTIIRNAFPTTFLNRRYQKNPPRSDQWYQNFLDRASGIFADNAVRAGKPVYFVGKFDGTVRDCSIWKRIELQTLLDGRISITLVDYSNFANHKPYPGKSENISIIFRKRDTKYCFDWPGPDAPVETSYYPGNCSLHLTQVSSALCSRGWKIILIMIQYQKNKGNPASNGSQATSEYRLSILFKDANQELIGEVDCYDTPGGQGVKVNSKMPLAFIATAGNVDDGPISFTYGNQTWNSNSSRCSVGGYDSGSRQMDCGFTC